MNGRYHRLTRFDKQFIAAGRLQPGLGINLGPRREKFIQFLCYGSSGRSVFCAGANFGDDAMIY